MNTQENKVLVLSAIDAVNHGKVDDAVAFTHPNCTLNGEAFGREGDRIRTQMFLSAFPDQVWTVDRLIAEGEWVSTSYTFRGTFLEKMGDFPPTGKPVVFTAVSLYHIKDRQFVEVWEFYDRLALYQQMGVIPAMA